MVRPETPAPAPGAPAPAAAPAAASAPRGARKAALITTCIAALALVAAVAFFARGRNEPPPLNADTVTIVKFASSDGYGKLSFDQQRQFMGVLEDRDDNDELKNAFNAAQVNEKEYRTAKLEAWAGEQLKRSDKYARTNGEAAKAKYIQELLARKEKSKSTKSKTDDPSDRSSAIKRDGTLEDARMGSIPNDVRQQWEKFRAAYSAAKDARDRVAETKPNP
jgi:hypothetical protein